MTSRTSFLFVLIVPLIACSSKDPSSELAPEAGPDAAASDATTDDAGTNDAAMDDAVINASDAGEDAQTPPAEPPFPDLVPTRDVKELATALGYPHVCAVDQGFVYYQTNGTSTIWRMPVEPPPPGDAGVPTETYVGTTTCPLFDESNIYVYSQTSISVGDRTLSSFEPTVSPDDDHFIGSVVIEGDNLYWTEGSRAGRAVPSKLWKRGKAEGSIATMLWESTELWEARLLGVRGDTVLWVMPNSVEFFALSAGATTPTLLARSPGSPRILVAHTLEGDSIFWSDAYAIYRLPTSGGTPIVMVSRVSFPTSLYANATHVYWTNEEGDVRRTERATHATVQVAKATWGNSIVGDGTWLVWADQGSLRRVTE